MTDRLKYLLLAHSLLLVTACSNQTVYEAETFDIDSPFRMRVDADAVDVCESARRTLLGQGYLVETSTGEELKARKATRSEESQNTFIEMNVACLPENTGSSLYATGLLSEYALKKSSSSASVGVSALGSISLPIGQSADSLVKVSEATIVDKEFYQRFFAVVNTMLSEMLAGRSAVAPQPEQPAAPVAVSAPGSAPLEARVIDTTQAKPEPAQPEPPVQPEPAHTQPVHTGTVQSEPVQTEAVQINPAQPDPAETGTAKTDSALPPDSAESAHVVQGEEPSALNTGEESTYPEPGSSQSPTPDSPEATPETRPPVEQDAAGAAEMTMEQILEQEFEGPPQALPPADEPVDGSPQAEAAPLPATEGQDTPTKNPGDPVRDLF